MAVVENEACDGCGERYHVDDLHVVSVKGSEIVCCSDCREHAIRADEQTVTKCERCASPVPDTCLEHLELPDRSELYCCGSCREELKREYIQNGTGTDVGATARDRSSGTRGSSGDASTTASNSRGSGGGSTARAGRRTAAGSRHSTGRTAGTSRTSNGTGRGTPSSRRAGSSTNGDGAGTHGDHSKPATTDDVCDQCGEAFTIELYKVVTVGNREKELCPDCKDAGVEEGIVRDVHLRRAQAFAVLGIESAADEETIRQAFLRRTKEVHPDREHGSRSEFITVKRAYERLTEDG